MQDPQPSAWLEVVLGVLLFISNLTIMASTDCRQT
jgi:hypothetical protein